jgi:tetratricopeptide (TPR) repeat protein
VGTARAAECPSVDARELRSLLELELGTRAAVVRLDCRDGRTELRLGALSRSLDLSSTPPSARARLVALAASEMLFASREPLAAPPATQRRNRSEAAMWKHVLATSMVIAPVAAAAPKPEVRVEAHPVVLPQKRAAEPAAPALAAEDVFSRVGAAVHAVTDAQKILLERLIAQSSGEEKADLLVRLGDLYVEEQRYHRFRARSLDQRIFEAEKKGRNAAELRNTQAAEEKQEKEATRAAVKRYLEVANGSYADYKKMDEVLYDLGRLLREVERPDAARTFWKRLVKDYPTSRYVPDGLLAFGDDAFERRDLPNALAFYQKVMSYSDSPLAEYARYKTGWCYFNLGDFKQALEVFVTVIDHTRTRGDSKLALLREAKKDLVRTYAHIGASDRAWPFFQRTGGESAAAMLEQLADLYNQQGKFPDAVRCYRQLMASAPQSPRLCAWQAEVVKNTLAQAGARAEPDSVRELERLSALQARSSAGDAECRDHTAGLLRELATVWHQEAQRTQQIPTYERAGALYREYLKSFPKAPDIVKMKFYYAELLYKLEKHCEAAPLYSEYVKTQSDHREDAALAAVLSWRSCLKLDDRAEPRSDGARRQNAPPRAIPEPWQKMIAAFELYLQYVRSSAERLHVQYQLGLSQYEFDRCDEAIPIFSEIAHKHPEADVAPYSADLLFDCRAQKADKVQLRKDVAELCSLPALTAQRPDFARRCRVIHGALLRDQAETLENDRHYKAAGDLYVQLAADYPDDPRLDEIFYNAAIDYQRANLVGLSILAFQELMRARPDSPLAKKATYLVGRSYQNIAAFEAAADNYEKFAEHWPGERDAPNALSRAAFLRRGLGDINHARDDAKHFFERYGQRSDLVDTAAALALAQAQALEGDPARLADHLEKYLHDYGARGGIDRQLIAHVKLGELAWRASCPIAGVGGSCIEQQRSRTRRLVETRKTGESCGGPVKIIVHQRRPDLVQKADRHFATALQLLPSIKHEKDEARVAEANYYAAQAKMLQADLEFERFLSLQLPSSQKKLAAWFADKTRELDQARQKYESVIFMKQAHWAIAAAGRVGQMFQVFAAQLNSSPVPPAPPPPHGTDPRTWKEDFKNAFCDQLAVHVVQLEDKAEDALKLCLDKSTSLSWFNEWSALCEAELHQMRPVRYPLAAELRAEPRFVSAAPDRAPPQP